MSNSKRSLSKMRLGLSLALVVLAGAANAAEKETGFLFDANGAHALGALGGKDNEPAFFGAPTQAEQEAMAKAVKS